MQPMLTDELKRLHTYLLWPDHAQIRPSSLARCGFRYTGFADKTQCEACQIVVENWQRGDNPEFIHRLRSPFCRFSANTNSQSQIASSSARLPSQPSPRRAREDTETDGIREIQQRNLAASAFHQNDDNVVDFIESDLFGEPSHALRSPLTNAPNIPDQINRTLPDFHAMRSESVRLETFHDWPATAARVVDPRDLIKAGLFYTGHSDRVQCAFCRGFLRNWVRGDRPIDEHRRHFPDCPFIREQDVGNVPIPSNNAPSLQPPSNARQPKHCQYSEMSARTLSFASGRVSRGQTAERLAKAGFFYVGPDDNVRCFWCNGGLKNFQADDDPWTEHARYFPRCTFLLQNKDQMFIDSCRPPEINSPRPAEHNGQSTTDADADAIMNSAATNSAAVKAVLDMGYSSQFVQQVVTQLMAAGNNQPTAEIIMENIFRKESDWQSDHATSLPAHHSANDADIGEAGSLVEENRRLQEARRCTVCKDRDVDTVFLPCGHLVCCSNCSPELSNCPICRTLIRGTVKIFLG